MTPVSIGMRLGRYEILSKLGSGGMADVYLAADTQLGRRVALKLLPPATTDNLQARQRLTREARAAAGLDHPHICAVYEVGETDGHQFIAMQFVEGQTLEARLREGALALADVLSIGVQVADALSEAHAHGVLHRDIKPGNIMMTPRGEAKVMDFGLAKPTHAEDATPGDTETAALVTTPGTIIGTVPYMSPEQVRGEALDRRSDIFSVGIVLYEMTSGRRPFGGTSAAAIASSILTHECPPLARFAPETPAEFERIVAKALKKHPEERYQTAKDLLIDLRALRDDQAFQARLVRTPPPDRTPAPITMPDQSSTNAPATRAARGWPAAVAVAALVALAAIGWFGWRSANLRWARAQLPLITAAANDGRPFDAYDLAVAVEAYLPADPTIAGLMPRLSDTISVTTDPPGAQVFLKRFAPDPSGAFPAREPAGVTPITSRRVARGEYVVSIEKEGYAPLERTVSGVTYRTGTLSITPPPIQLDLKLVPAGEMPAGMVFVPGGDYRLVGWARPTDRRVPGADFYIDRYEVTNEDFKQFIDAGGYVKREFWTRPFVRDGRVVSWDEAMRTFTDRTGLPGPRAWSNQRVPDGKAHHPVTDVSWYEAAAYAEFRGKRLPTVFQWEKSARNGAIGPAGVTIMPWGVFYPGDPLPLLANFGAGTLPVTSLEFGMSPFGAYNMAGNVAEWTLNDSSDGFLATGGAWGDPTYTFAQYGGRPGFYSSDKLGFRLARPAVGAPDEAGAERIESATQVPEYAVSTPEEFSALAASYRYEKSALDARIEETVDMPGWRREKITFNGTGGERAIAYLYLPHHVARPLQVLHYVPAADVAGGFRSLDSSMDDRMVPFVLAGRAAFGVVLKGYVERLLPSGSIPPEPTTVEFVESSVHRITDLRRGLDYLETRADLDRTRIGFFGPSAGAFIGLILTAVEDRYRAITMVGAGLPREWIPVIAEANPIHFAPHMRGPKLLVQGRYDEDTHLRTAAEPLFKLWPEPKRLFVYEGGHVPTNEVLMGATRDWLDEVMGPVRR